MTSTLSNDLSGELSDELAALPRVVLEKLSRFHFDKARFLELSRRVSGSSASDNYVKGRLEAPGAEDVVDLKPPPENRAFHEKGLELLSQGKSALVVLAGGMATRMGGVVKALVPAIERALSCLRNALRLATGSAAGFRG